MRASNSHSGVMSSEVCEGRIPPDLACCATSIGIMADLSRAPTEAVAQFSTGPDESPACSERINLVLKPENRLECPGDTWPRLRAGHR